MAKLSQAQVDLLAERQAVLNRGNAEGGGGFGAGLAAAVNRYRLEKIDAQLVKQPAAKAAPKPAPKAKPAAAPATMAPAPAATAPAAPVVPEAPAMPAMPGPILQSPMQSPIGQTGGINDPNTVPAVPTMDDAAARVDAAEPRSAVQDLREVASPLAFEPKRKKYGIAATTLTGEKGLSRLGGIATRTLLG